MIADPPDEMVAAELALGLLDGVEREQARALEATDPAFAKAVSAWSDRLAPLLDEVAAVAPPSAVLDALLRRIALPQPANDPLPALHRSVTTWRTATGLASALAACLALVVLLRPDAATLPPAVPTATQPAVRAAPLVAVVGQGTSAIRMLASYDPAGRQLVLAATAPLNAPSQRDYELWVIPAAGKPVSLGVLNADRSHRQLSPALAGLIVPGATLAVTVEPDGGSQTGQPSGAPIAAGKLDQA